MGKKWSLADLIMPTLGAIFSVYYISTVQGIPRNAQLYGMSLSIATIGIALLLFAIAVKNDVLKNLTSIKKYINRNKDMEAFKNFIKVAFLTLLILLYILITPLLGYPITSIIFICSVMFYLGERKRSTLIYGAFIVTSIGFILFILFLNVRLPLDPITRVIKELLVF